MSKLDPYSMTDRIGDDAIASMITRLEARGRNPFFRRMLDEYLDALDPARLSRVLEIGCGTGVATRALATYPKFSGHIFASDLSPGLIEAASRLAEEAECSEKVTFATGDKLAMAASDPYDAVIAHTVISHVPDYRGFLSAVARAVVPGGQVAIFDGDYASITVGAENVEDGEAFSGAMIDAMITNPTVMRQMPWLAADANLEITKSFSYLLSEIGTAQFFVDAFSSLPVLIPKTGIADQARVQTWVDQQMGYSQAGRFFGAINFYTYLLSPMRGSNQPS